MRWLIHLLVNSVVLVVVAGYFDGFYLESVSAAILASVLLSIINVILKPILVILTLPVTVITFGFFLFVINAITLMITASLMGDAFQISGFGMAVFAAIIISILNMLINTFVVKPMQKK
ncbi:phage holin family protein [Anaerobacillus isosaccharinicus]|uniref:Phage holin family protein n=1 Tax=Anaerobacillus isosaccharinicus TaxID=1532552 RepID=A0A1S2MHA5_9BACI|nr:phage holin family protein [Anaerobacillus isosaccharinicus]MBA5584658.1 phage holin family protein [Anaerobacillus isosaccharinicus]QOY36968.1 phage holin family protein [Anaerobacillus isosaccharinicus]